MGLLETELALVVALLLVMLAVALIYGRRRVISHNSDVVLCGYRRAVTRRWRPALLRMSATTLQLYPLFGWTTRPRHTWQRHTLDLPGTQLFEHDRRLASLLDRSGTAVQTPVSGRTDTGEAMTFEVALARAGYTALRYWVEASPPTARPVDG